MAAKAGDGADEWVALVIAVGMRERLVSCSELCLEGPRHGYLGDWARKCFT